MSKASDAFSNADPAQIEQEMAVGITAIISPDVPGFTATFKQRYTDFQVNEIVPGGEVLHLNEAASPPSKAAKRTVDKNAVSTEEKAYEQNGTKRSAQDEEAIQDSKRVKIEDKAQGENDVTEQNGSSAFAIDAAVAALDSVGILSVRDIFGSDTADEIIRLYAAVLKHPFRKPRDHATITSSPIESKATRTQAHGIIRNLFNSRLETATLQDQPGCMTIRAAPPKSSQHNDDRKEKSGATRSRNRGRTDWNELGGQYLHFTLYKENKDTMEVLYFMASTLKMRASLFEFAGTKDRRGVTVQRVTAYRVLKERLMELTGAARGWKIGDFEYKKHGLKLGDLDGNEFVVGLRDVQVASLGNDLEATRAAVEKAADAFAAKGFINYYGLQRFGAFKTGTHLTGMKMIQGDLEGAVNGILAYDEALVDADPVSSAKLPKDDVDRARGIHLWRSEGDIDRARHLMPKRFQAEVSIMQALSRKNDGGRLHDNDFRGALMSIQRGLRLMYVHAYQSFIWNTVASERWRLYGSAVVEGDLVITGQDEPVIAIAEGAVDQDGQEVIHATASAEPDDAIEDFVRARPLSKEEAASGRYSIYDIVLPQPGFDVLYPSNDIGTFYKTLMASEQGGNLDPTDMRRAWKDVSLSGSYRKMMARPLNGVSVQILPYQGEQQLAPTDIDRLLNRSIQEDEGQAGDQKLAAILRFQLGSSQYATMALRELTKGGASAYKPEFNLVR